MLDKTISPACEPLNHSDLYEEPEIVNHIRGRHRGGGDSKRRKAVHVLFSRLLYVVLGLTCGMLLQDSVSDHDKAVANDTSACHDPTICREWRSLAPDEKQTYIKADHSLKQKPFRLGLSQSLYDDFLYAHFCVGGHGILSEKLLETYTDRLPVPADGAAAFLAWQRYFLFTFRWFRTGSRTCRQ